MATSVPPSSTSLPVVHHAKVHPLPVLKPRLFEWNAPQWWLLQTRIHSGLAFQVLPPEGCEAHTHPFWAALGKADVGVRTVTRVGAKVRVAYELEYSNPDMAVQEAAVAYFAKGEAGRSVGTSGVFDAAHATVASLPPTGSLRYADGFVPRTDNVTWQDYMRTLPAYLRPKSQFDVCRVLDHDLEGLTEPFAFVGTWATGTGWHDEDDGSASVHVLGKGRKVWYFVRRRDRGKLDNVLDAIKFGKRNAGLTVKSRRVFVSPAYLTANGIDVYVADHTVARGSVIVSVGGLHQVINVDACLGLAWNLYPPPLLANCIALAADRRNGRASLHAAMMVPLDHVLWRLCFPCTTALPDDLVAIALARIDDEERAHRALAQIESVTVSSLPPTDYDPANPEPCDKCHNRLTSWSVCTVGTGSTLQVLCVQCRQHEAPSAPTTLHVIRSLTTLRELARTLRPRRVADPSERASEVFERVPIRHLLRWTFTSRATRGPTVTRSTLLVASRNALRCDAYGWTDVSFYNAWFRWLAQHSCGTIGETMTRGGSIIFNKNITARAEALLTRCGVHTADALALLVADDSGHRTDMTVLPPSTRTARKRAREQNDQ